MLAGAAIGQTKAIRVFEPAKKRALVIGNQEYPVAKLLNPVNDALAIGSVLKNKLGFDSVEVRKNLKTKAEMDSAVVEFAKKLQPGDLAFFYYSGHGMQAVNALKGEKLNFLLPTAFDSSTEEHLVPVKALSFRDVRIALERAQARVLVQDACRNHPYARQRGSGGLAATIGAEGELIAYATQPGQLATDRGDGMGRYAKALVEALSSRVEIVEVFRQVQEQVHAQTANAQFPMYLPLLTGRLYLNGLPESGGLSVPGLGGGAVAPDLGRKAEDMLDSMPPPKRTNSLGMEFVRIRSGRFVMGSPEGEAGRSADETQREVTISQDFWMGKYEVTQGEWEAVMGSNLSYFDGCGSRCPVEAVSWEDVQEFIQKLNAREAGKGYRYRLPTEAEWEYAARAGTRGARYGKLGAIAWYWENSGGTTRPVGRKRPNAWGLHDMLGNVWEWTADWYGDYAGGAVTDPTGPSTGSARVYRGGSWSTLARYVRSAYRFYYSPGIRGHYIGFRLVRTN